jgi:hypothetical protein
VFVSSGAFRIHVEPTHTADQIGQEGKRHVGDALLVGGNVSELANAFERSGRSF